MMVKDKPKLNDLVHTGRTGPGLSWSPKPIGGSEAARTKRLSGPTAPWSHLRNVGWAGWWSLRDGEN